MASFEDKVEALRRLRDRRQARQAQAEVATVVTERPVPVVEPQTEELTAVLEHYAKLQEPTGDMSSYDDHGAAARRHSHLAPAPGVARSDDEEEEAAALYCLGHCFEQGLHECEKDEAKAAMYYRLAAEKGSSMAQWRLGHIHEFGVGVEASDVLAARWYRIAAEAGHPQAQTSFAIFLEDGRGLSRDSATALQWHLAAAAQDQALSQYCAACRLADSGGDIQDEALARSLLEKSAAAGFPLAVKALSAGSAWRGLEDEDVDEASDHEMDDSVLNIAERVARKLGHLSDEEAEAFLDDLMGCLGDTSTIDCEEFRHIMERSEPNVHPGREAARPNILGLVT